MPRRSYGTPAAFTRDGIMFPSQIGFELMYEVCRPNGIQHHHAQLIDADRQHQYNIDHFGKYSDLFLLVDPFQVSMTNPSEYTTKIAARPITSNVMSVLSYGIAWDTERKAVDHEHTLWYYQKRIEQGFMREIEFYRMMGIHNARYKELKDLGLLFKLASVKSEMMSTTAGRISYLHRPSVNPSELGYALPPA